jgi:two-component system cell cycle response regulator
MVVEWQKDVLHDIGGILALLIDNLRLNREIKRKSIIDPLTQTYNRHYFVSRLATEVRRARRYSRPTSLIFSDVDRFKEINDKYGHLQGDDVLQDLGKLFLASTREVDVVCRYGGDEFVILLPETSLDMARQTAEKICQSVSSHAFRNLDNPAITLPVTLSVGVSALGGEQNEEEFLRRADEALYEAKKLGRNRVSVDSERL